MLTMAIPDAEILAVRLFAIWLWFISQMAPVSGSKGGEFTGIFWCGVEGCKTLFL